ncbi:hypothetical protein [Hymenobacter sediminicola]|uniref:Outer membrane beta-barrel protein n=1 Tax=Hymenobacter sediminicola TaxID=2761579 RepID=A0A7G7W7I8_9BACT|nr:hypothetical protein [Hymenobacter sediminicola]QNH62331.1 hypothetical protein H4317_00440 [Hymenobacter sediminicola]
MMQLSTVCRSLAGMLLLHSGIATAQDAAPARLPATRGVPFFLSLQIGGGAGMVAIGGGVRLAGQRLEPEVLVGHVPRRFSSQPLTIFTFKTTYLPVNPKLGKHWRASPAFGGYINYTSGATLQDSHQPGKYPNNYYWFSTKVRTGMYLAPRVSYAGIRTPERPAPPHVAAYAELGTNDLYFISRTTNKRAPVLTEIMTLGFGSKIAW